MSGRSGAAETRPVVGLVTGAFRLIGAAAAAEYRASALYRASLKGPTVSGVAIRPRPYRPPDIEGARRLLNGRLTLAGETMEIGQGGDPWDTPSPSRRFAVELHRFAWLPGLMALDPNQYPEAADEALRLVLDWLPLFGVPSAFAWSCEVAERRVYNLACAVPTLIGLASELEQRRMLQSLAAQARHLLALGDEPPRAAERAAVAGLAGALLAGAAGDAILRKALGPLSGALRHSVLADGAVRSRSPEQGMELLFDLLTLDDALHQRGRPSPDLLNRSIDRLTGAVRFFTLGDGRLAAFQGGESSSPERVRAAIAHEEGGAAVFDYAPHAGYHRMAGRRVLAMLDAAPPAAGAWSVAACAQPLAMEVTCSGDRLIVNTGWSPDASAPPALRLSDGGSTVTVGDASPGEPLRGWRATAFGPRLVGGAAKVDARRNENEQGIWIELRHDGWARRFGICHERRMFLDLKGDELRGEDAFAPVEGAAPRRSLTPFTARFHLGPDIKVSLARDKRSVLLRAPSSGGWWFRNDAEEVALEPSVHYEAGVGRRALQIVLRSRIGLDGQARVRWKLSPVELGETAGAGS